MTEVSPGPPAAPVARESPDLAGQTQSTTIPAQPAPRPPFPAATGRTVPGVTRGDAGGSDATSSAPSTATGAGGADRNTGAPTGDRATAATSGSSTSGSAEAEYRAYLALVRQRIHEALQYPRAARQQGLTGTVHLDIIIQPSGAIGDVKIISSSSHPVLDRAALEAVRSLPPIGFPPGLAPRPLSARLPVVFELR
jgi:protein TonB